MRFSEAMMALDEGKKVRCKVWDPEDYLSKESDSSQFNGIGYFRSYEWEIYEETPKTYSFVEILPLVKDGKRFTRPKWPKEMSFGKNSHGIYRINLYGGEQHGIYEDDIEATDWEEIK